MRTTVLLLLASGCYSEGDFTPARTAAFCAKVLECTDPAVLAFDGVTAENCEGVYGPAFAAEGETCKLDKKAAKTCVRGLQSLTCPADGSPVAENVPAVCDEVFVKCDGAQAPVDTDVASETGI